MVQVSCDAEQSVLNILYVQRISETTKGKKEKGYTNPKTPEKNSVCLP
jgi:hypothetical protein